MSMTHDTALALEADMTAMYAAGARVLIEQALAELDASGLLTVQPLLIEALTSLEGVEARLS